LSSCPVESQETELRESKKRIEEVLSAPCRFFAYPNGMPADFTAETESAVRRAGYSLAVTMESGFSSDPPVQPFRLRRWGAGIPPADLAYLVSGACSLSAH
jgi:peptidoglycan/xylan/chitin deacetylase (PgdA/CDA1 family)